MKNRQNVFNKRITRQKPGKRVSGNWRITVQLDKWLTSREGPDFSHCKISFPTIIPYPATLGSHFSQPTVNTPSPDQSLFLRKSCFENTGTFICNPLLMFIMAVLLTSKGNTGMNGWVWKGSAVTGRQSYVLS